MRASKCDAFAAHDVAGDGDSADDRRPRWRLRVKDRHARPVIMLVPFISDSASFGCSASGATPACSSA